jgi:hypothetical protein
MYQEEKIIIMESAMNQQVQQSSLSLTPPSTQNVPVLPCNKTAVTDEHPEMITELIDPDIVLRKYHNLTPLSKISRLSVKLALELLFAIGIDAVKSSAVQGCSDKPALPKQDLKHFLVQHPQFDPPLFVDRVRSGVFLPLEFEHHWRLCIDSINHACATLRAKDYKQT